MEKDQINSPNDIKYSIWETRTDKIKPVAKKGITNSVEKSDMDLKRTENGVS